MSKLSVYDFGTRLLETNDLDPVYVLLWEVQLEPDLLKRWLLAYWCFYHVGTACWISEGNYWNRMHQAANSSDYPRSTERRHFRADSARKSIAYLESIGVDNLFTPLLKSPSTIAQLSKRVQQWVGFGPWISFKVGDMLERLALAQISFDIGSAYLYSSPQEGARVMWEKYGKGKTDKVEEWAMNTLVQVYRSKGIKAPPRYDRLAGVQEAETILCKWNSYLNGHYEVGEDIEACRRGLLKFAKCKLSQRLLSAGRQGKLWQ